MPDRAAAAGHPGGLGPLGRQLEPPAFVLDVRPPGARPGPARRAGSGAGAASPAPSILLLSRSCDAEMDAVARLLGRAGLRCARLDADQLGAADVLVDVTRGALRLNGRWLTPTVTWTRHFTGRAIAGPGGPARQAFTRDSWQALADELSLLSGVAVHREPPPGRLAQLRLAARLGIAVPRTVVSTDPGRDAAMVPGPRLVIKALDEHFVEAAPGRLTGVFPVLAGRRELPGGQAGPPVLLQEYIEHDRELRVYYLAGQLHGFEISRDAPADPWLAPGRVQARCAVVPPAVAVAARRLVTAWSLRFGAFDFLLRDRAPVFLEANVTGDWRWAEALAGADPVTRAAARMLCDLHRAARPAGSGPDREPFDVLGFLSGRAAGPTS
ncbi:MAG TPA: hypothetical protein VK586_12425 [Streptosporangiaceae bacterium]|nr:hypothetical protein [Streptosporangiaceae bacterium]